MPLDARIIKSTHRASVQKRRYSAVVDLAVMIVCAVQVNRHVFIAPVVAQRLDEAASVHVGAVEWWEIDLPSVFNWHLLGSKLRRSISVIDARNSAGQ